jgi:hypothetical protein
VEVVEGIVGALAVEEVEGIVGALAVEGVIRHDHIEVFFRCLFLFVNKRGLFLGLFRLEGSRRRNIYLRGQLVRSLGCNQQDLSVGRIPRLFSNIRKEFQDVYVQLLNGCFHSRLAFLLEV